MSVIQLPGSCLSAAVSICTLCHGPRRHHAWQTLMQTPHTRPVEQTKRKHTSVRPHRPSGYIIECGRLACFLRGKFFPLLPACPVRRNLRSRLTMPAARLPGLTLVFPALPYFAHFDVVHVSQRIAGRGSNRVATDPRSWACILPAGECSSVRLIATAVQFAARAAASTRDPGAPPAWASARFCSSVKRGRPQGSGCEEQNLPIGSCEGEPRYCNAMHAGSCQGRIRVARHIIFVCVCRTPNTLARCCRASWRDAASLFLLDCICVLPVACLS